MKKRGLRGFKNANPCFIEEYSKKKTKNWEEGGVFLFLWMSSASTDTRQSTIQAAIKRCLAIEHAGQRTGKRCKVNKGCHLKRANKEKDIPANQWPAHTCKEELLDHSYANCPTQFLEGVHNLLAFLLCLLLILIQRL